MIHITDAQTDIILADITEDYFWDDIHKKSLKDTLETFDFITFADQDFSEHLAKRNRVIIPDEDGQYIEFVIENTRKFRNIEGALLVEVYTTATYIVLAKAKVIAPQTTQAWSAQQHAEWALAGTEWQIGTVDFAGVRTLTIEQHTNPYSYLKRLSTEFDLELHFRVETDGNKVIRRYVDLVERVGMWRGREVEFGKDLLGIERKEDMANIVTALVGLGPEREDGTRLQVFVEDKDALARWGRNGQHLVEVYEPQSTDSTMTEEQLRTLTENELEKCVNSVVSYRADIADLEKVPGLEHERIRFGDTIKIKDTAFSPPLYLEARVHTQERSIKRNGRKTVELGDYIEYTEEEVFAIWKSLQAEIAKKVSMTEVMEVTYDKQTIDTKDNTVYDNSKSYADDAKQEAITVSATDATNKANQAEQNAKDHADTVAEQKKQQAIQEAIQQAQNELNQVKTELESDIAEKVDATWVEGQLQSKADKVDTYTKTEVDNALNSKVSVTQYTTDINGIVTDLNSVESRVSQTESEIATKVSNTTYQQDKQVIEGNISTLETRIDNAETSITQNANQIALKANATDVYTKTEIDGQFSTVNQEITDIEAELSVQADEIALKVSQTEFETFQTKALIDKGNAPNVDWNTIQETGIYNVNYGSNPKPTNFPQGAYGWGTLIVERSSVGTVTQTYKAHSTPPRTYYRMNYGGNESNWRDWQEVTRKADFDALEGRVTTAESTITQHADMIATKVSQTELDTAIDGIGKRLSFDGINDRVQTNVRDQVGNLFADANNVWAVGVWFRTSESNDSTIVGLGGGTGTAATFGLFVDTNGHLRSVLRGAYTTIKTNINDGLWHCCMITWDGTTALAYFDDFPPITLNVGTASMQTNFFTIGANGSGSNTYFKGNVNLVSIWTEVPSSDIIERFRSEGLTGTESGLLAYWKLNEGHGTIAYDSVGNNNGTINGATWVGENGLTSQFLGYRLSSAESTITQQAAEIESKVSYTDYNGNEIASRINQTATTVKIEASRIEFAGHVFGQDATFTGNIVGGSITSNTTINVTTDLRVGNNIYIGDINDYANDKYIYFNGASSISGHDNDIEVKTGYLILNGVNLVALSLTNSTYLDTYLNLEEGNILIKSDLGTIIRGTVKVLNGIEANVHESLPLMNGWTSYSSSFVGPAYTKSADGFVHLRGMIKDGPINTVCGVLPAGCRPYRTEIFIVATYGDTRGLVYIYNDGRVYISSGHPNWVSLSGIVFRAEN